MPPRQHHPFKLSAKRRAERRRKQIAVVDERDSRAKLDRLLKLNLRFNPRAEGFSGENALFLAAAAQCAYQDGWARQVFPGATPAFKTIVPFRSDEFDTEGFTMSNRDAVVVVFTGTESLQDWFQNFDLALTKFTGARVHKGFWDALNAVWISQSNSALCSLLEKANKQGKRIWFAGHSLGGALALLAGARAVYRDLPVQGIYTFGQPLIGDATFGTRFRSLLGHCTFRITNEKDPVPLIPPRGEILGEKARRKKLPRRRGGRRSPRPLSQARSSKYADFGHHILIKPPGPKLHPDTLLRLLDCPIAQAMVRVAARLNNKKLIIANHNMTEYIDGLGRNRTVSFPPPDHGPAEG